MSPIGVKKLDIHIAGGEGVSLTTGSVVLGGIRVLHPLCAFPTYDH
jgi:hypothetical protein